MGGGASSPSLMLKLLMLRTRTRVTDLRLPPPLSGPASRPSHWEGGLYIQGPSPSNFAAFRR